MNYIAKFNPYSMDDETILAVATGRKCLLGRVVKTLEDNLNSESVAQHTLIRGPRGMGKSFFLKYLQITFRQSGKFDNCEFLLLPEEQNNINTPSDLIKLILSELTQQSGVDATTFWEEPDEVWQIELQKLKKYLSEKKSAQKDYMLVVVLENLDTFLHNIKSDKKTAKVHESRFRHLLERIKDLTIIGAVPRVDSDIIDGNYNKRLFHAFKKCTLKKWTTEDYFKYFDRRKDLSGIEMTEAEESLKRAKLKALSHFTGGSPRIAVVLTNLLLEDNVISTANTLFGLIDDLTPYYQDLTKSIPKQSKKLFDTLIRKGEKHSQSELAEALGTTQSKISKAFLWLQYNGYVIGTKRSDSPAFSYQVADRIHVLYYQLREINHNQHITPIWLLSDFLVAFYQSDELRTHAFKALSEQPSANANDLAKLYLISSGLFGKGNLPKLDTSEEWIDLIEKNKEIKSLLEKIEEQIKLDNDISFADFEITVKKLIAILNRVSDNKNVLRSYIVTFNTKLIDSHESKRLNFLIYLFENFLSLEKKADDMSVGITYWVIGMCQMYLLNFKLAESHLKKAHKTLGRYKNMAAQLEYQLKDMKETQRLSNFMGQNYSDEKGYPTNNIFNSLIEVEKEFNYSTSVSWGITLLSMLIELEGGIKLFPSLIRDWAASGISKKLIIDICMEALKNPKIISETFLQFATHTVKYLESSKSPTYLEKLPPDTAIAIKAIVEEANL